AYSGEDKYFEGGRKWALALSRVWIKEGDGDADGNKAYAVTRLLKGLAVSYDLLYDRLSGAGRAELRGPMLTVGREYDEFLSKLGDGFGPPDYEEHHGSVEAASFGLVALSLLGDAPETDAWLDLMVKKHVEWLLPKGFTKSGTHNKTSNFWISMMQYRCFFMD